jgi:hypothetical protein
LLPFAGRPDVDTLRRQALLQRVQMGRCGDDEHAIIRSQAAAYKSLQRVQDNAILLIDLDQMFARRDLSPEDFDRAVLLVMLGTHMPSFRTCFILSPWHTCGCVHP